jgi:hypothetical protein
LSTFSVAKAARHAILMRMEHFHALHAPLWSDMEIAQVDAPDTVFEIRSNKGMTRRFRAQSASECSEWVAHICSWLAWAAREFHPHAAVLGCGEEAGWGAVRSEPLFSSEPPLGDGGRHAERDVNGPVTELRRNSSAALRQRRILRDTRLQSAAIAQRVGRGFLGRRRFQAAKLERQLRLWRQALTAEEARLLEDVGRLIASDVRRALSPSLSPLLLDDERLAVAARPRVATHMRQVHAEAEDAIGKTGLRRLHDAHGMLVQCMSEVRDAHCIPARHHAPLHAV